MKTKGQVIHHLRQRVFRAQKKYLSFQLKKTHYNCRYVFSTPHPIGSGPVVTCCSHTENLEISKYDVEIGNLIRSVPIIESPPCNAYNGRAANCPYFAPHKEKADLQIEFRKALLEKSKNPSEIAEAHPDIAQLLWVLGVESLESLESLPEQALTAEDEEGLLCIREATMEAAMDAGPGLDDPEHPEYEDPEPAKEQAKEGEEVLKKALACFDDLQKPLPDPPTLSLVSSKPHTIRQTPAFGFPTWISWIWGK